MDWLICANEIAASSTNPVETKEHRQRPEQKNDKFLLKSLPVVYPFINAAITNRKKLINITKPIYPHARTNILDKKLWKNIEEVEEKEANQHKFVWLRSEKKNQLDLMCDEECIIMR